MLSHFNISKNILSIDNLSKFIWISGKIAIFLAVGVSISSREKLDIYNTIKPVSTDNFNQSDESSSKIFSNPDLDLIVKRDLFSLQKKAEEKVVEKEKKKSDLKFRLVGTSITKNKPPFAIIENDKKQQDVFEKDELIFSKATLKEIHSDYVVLLRDGSLETLEVEGGTRDSSESGISSSGTDFVVPEDEVNDALNNLPRLLSEARAVPYFRNGESIGMRLYAIKSGSLYEKLGLKNSDIIKEINNKQVNDPSKALKLFEDLKSERSIGVSVERNGEDVRLQYQIR